MIIFVGSNPSNASPDFTPFHYGTKSRTVLESWIEAAGIKFELPDPFARGCSVPNVFLHNIIDAPTPNNRPLNKTEINESIPRIKNRLSKYTKVVALGKTAHKVLTMAGVPHLEMPHPSGLNRKLNNPKYVAECIERLREYAK